jgi:D-alanyl-D-alanine carboxypeptidase/D-alanyl-D-alanine-endopeptidase (penicillin-binding protein 4)
VRAFRPVAQSDAVIRRVSILLALATAVAYAQPVSRSVGQLRHEIDAILGAPALQHGFWGVDIRPVDGKTPWYSRNADKLMLPASSLKVLTLAAAADQLGWDFRYDTKVFVSGQVRGGVLHGDLVVVGSGDPSLDDWDGIATRLWAGWAEQLKAAGITAIDGRIVGDDNAFDDDGIGYGWAWDDIPAGFAAPASALQFNEGNVQVRLGPGDAVGDRAIATLTPDTSGMTLRSLITTGPPGSPGQVTRRRLPGSTRLELRGTLPLRGRPYAMNASVDNPTFYYVRALRTALVADGIPISGAAVDIDDLMPAPSHDGLTPLITSQSDPLSVLATTMMKLSQNQYAEALLKTIGGGSSEAGRMAVKATLQNWGIDPATVILADGSGLSRYNYVTPETMVAVLLHVEHSETLRDVYESTLPIAGRDGTLEDRMRGTAAQGRALVKTGSMTGVRSTVGYVRTAGGQQVAFAIIANNFENSASVLNGATDDVIARLAAYRGR